MSAIAFAVQPSSELDQSVDQEFLDELLSDSLPSDVKVDDKDHDYLVGFLPLLESAVNQTLRKLKLFHELNDGPIFFELFGHGQLLLIEQHLKGILTEHLVKHYMPLRLMDYYTEDECIRISASTNRSREEAGKEPYRIKYEQHADSTKASFLGEEFHPVCHDPDLDDILETDALHAHDDFAEAIQWFKERKKLEKMHDTRNILYLFCAEDEIDRTIIDSCLRDFDEVTYKKSDRKRQQIVAEELGISSSSIQRRIAAIWQRFDQIKRPE